MQIEPVSLEGRTIRLEPLERTHADGLLKAADPDIFRLLTGAPKTWDVPGFEGYIDALLAQPAFLPFAIVARESEQAIGTTSYMDIRTAHRGLEIGSTWIGRAYQGTQINPECKYLLLRHAFEVLDFVRVQLKTDGRNQHSQRAIAKLGAKYEGSLRRHMILPDGYIRDTVMFSIISDEWPQVKAGLAARLGYVPQ